MTTPVTVAITRRVRPGHEAAFESALHEFIAQSLKTPGQLGVYVLRPEPGSVPREYGILRRFADAASRDAFYQSAIVAEWQQKVAPLTEGEPRYEHVSGLETWFTVPGRRAIVPPPRWKMALVTLLAVYPASLLIAFVIGPWIRDWPVALQSLVVGVAMVAVLTWLFMPALARLLRRWLYPVPQEGG